MSKQFVRTADCEFINMDFIHSIIFRKVNTKEKEIFQIILQCVDGEVIAGYALDEQEAIAVIYDMMDDVPLTCYGMTYKEVLECVKRKSKDESEKIC